MKKEVKSQRLQSLDALRGFDMFFIMGGGALLRPPCKVSEWIWISCFTCLTQASYLLSKLFKKTKLYKTIKL